MNCGDISDVAERILQIVTEVSKVPLYPEYVVEQRNMAQKLHDVLLQKTENLK
jgi:hypothetical protein